MKQKDGIFLLGKGAGEPTSQKKVVSENSLLLGKKLGGERLLHLVSV